MCAQLQPGRLKCELRPKYLANVVNNDLALLILHTSRGRAEASLPLVSTITTFDPTTSACLSESMFVRAISELSTVRKPLEDVGGRYFWVALR